MSLYVFDIIVYKFCCLLFYNKVVFLKLNISLAKLFG